MAFKPFHWEEIKVATWGQKEQKSLNKFAQAQLEKMHEEAKEDQHRLYEELKQQKQLEQMRQFYGSNIGYLTGGRIGGALGLGQIYSATYRPAVTTSQIEELKQVEPRTAHKPMPDSITMITGYRAWRVSTAANREMYLMAVGQSTKWEPKKKIAAVCVTTFRPTVSDPGLLGPGHAAPQFNCTCGVWAFKSIDMLPAALHGQGHRNEIRVIGSVDLWGRVIETENGFRAQYAYPKELWLLDEGLEELGWIYGVKIRSLTTKDAK